MKLNQMLKGFVFFLAVSGLASSSFAGGRDIGNGGDSYAIEFAAYAQSLIAHWDEFAISSRLPVSKEAFASALARTVVYSTNERLIIGDHEVDAKNFPFCDADAKQDGCGKIILNRDRWNQADLPRKTALVLHEYLGVMGIEARRFDDFYEVTSALFSSIRTLVGNQSRVISNFACWVEAWDSKKNAKTVIAVVETYNSGKEAYLVLPNEMAPTYFISIDKVWGDMFASTISKQLAYKIYKVRPYRLPEQGDALSQGHLEFRVDGRKSARALSSPELQLTCFRTFDSLESK